MIGRQNLCCQLMDVAKVLDGLLLGESPSDPHVNMLGILCQNVLLLGLCQNRQAVCSSFKNDSLFFMLSAPLEND